MGIFDRMSRLWKSNANAAIDKLSDPAKEVEQLILEMEEQLRAARGETVKVRATEKRCAARVTELEKQVVSWGERAEVAVRAGDDPLAREALTRKDDTEKALAEARRELHEASDYSAKLTESLRGLEARIKQYRLKKGTIKAKATMGKRALSVGSADAFEEFDRMSEKVEEGEVALEAERELAGELGAAARDAEVETRLAKLPKGDAMTDRLAALKAKMEKDKKEHP